MVSVLSTTGLLDLTLSVKQVKNPEREEECGKNSLPTKVLIILHKALVPKIKIVNCVISSLAKVPRKKKKNIVN